MISESETRQNKRGGGKTRQRQPKRRETIYSARVMNIGFFVYTKVAKCRPKAIRTLNNGDAGDSKCRVR